MNFLQKVTPFSNLRLFIILTFEYFFGQSRQLVDADLDVEKARKASSFSVILSSILFNDYKRVNRVEDKTLNGILCRIYSHSEASNKPVLLFFHSGGFALFDYKAPNFTCRRLCRMLDAIVISVDYRKAPEHKFGAAQEDSIAVLKWAKENVAELGGDPEKIFAIGHSAGGYLAAYLAKFAANNPEYAIKGHMPFYPWLDIGLTYPSINERDYSPIGTKVELHWYKDHYINSEEDLKHPDADLTRQDSFENHSPALVMVSEMDILADEGNAYAQNLKAANVPIMHREYKDMSHGYLYFPNVFNPRKEEHPFKYIQTFVENVLAGKDLPDISS